MKYFCATCGGPAEKSGTGLGTWRCARGCPPKRPGTIVRFIGSGKEDDSVGSKRREESVQIVRKMVVKRTKGGV